MVEFEHGTHSFVRKRRKSNAFNRSATNSRNKALSCNAYEEHLLESKTTLLPFLMLYSINILHS